MDPATPAGEWWCTSDGYDATPETQCSTVTRGPPQRPAATSVLFGAQPVASCLRQPRYPYILDCNRMSALSPLPLGRWVRVRLSRCGGAVSLWVDGELQFRYVAPTPGFIWVGAPKTNTSQYTVGGDYPGSYSYLRNDFNGQIANATLEWACGGGDKEEGGQRGAAGGGSSSLSPPPPRPPSLPQLSPPPPRPPPPLPPLPLLTTAIPSAVVQASTAVWATRDRRRGATTTATAFDVAMTATTAMLLSYLLLLFWGGGGGTTAAGDVW